MKVSRYKPLPRALSLLLILILLLAPGAQALSAEQARELLTKYYVDEIPEQVLGQDSVEDIILALGDPYTQYMDAEEYGAFLSSMQDRVVVGIGISIAQHESGLLLAGIFSGSSAEAAGLVAGDIIVSVDGQTTAGEDYEVAAAWIRGEDGTQVTIEVLHADGTVQDYTLTRRPVVISATTSEQVDGHICYIVCDTFGVETLGHFQEGIDTYGGTSDHFIIDLRSNPGGDVGAAVGSLGLFLGQGNMVSLRDGTGEYMNYVSYRSSQSIYPVMVLTSPWTASASEIFSAAVRDMQDGLIIGTRTFGKGVAQILLDSDTAPEYFEDGSAMKITAYRYFSPAGNTADKIGVIPHLLISEEYTADVAYLLCAADPQNDNEGSVRIHLGGWRWYLDPADTAKDELRQAVRELLEALPPEAQLYLGAGGGVWNKTTIGEVASSLGVDTTPRIFADAAGSPYETQINTLRAYEIVLGRGDGLFHPGDTMTRAELCAMLAQAMNVTAKPDGNAFTDVPEQAWYAPYVSAMWEMGLVEGCGDGRFCPMDIIDHEQFITIMARLAARLNLQFYELDKAGSDEKTLSDESLAAYSDWAKSSAWLLGKSQTNLLGGEVNLLFKPVAELDPSAPTLREEAAALVCSVLEYTGILAY